MRGGVWEVVCEEVRERTCGRMCVGGWVLNRATRTETRSVHLKSQFQ